MSIYIKKIMAISVMILYYVGIVTIILSIPYLLLRISLTESTIIITEEWMWRILYSFVIPGFLMTVISGWGRRRIYRCPKCNEYLVMKEFLIKDEMIYCSKCGTSIEIKYR